MHTNNPDTNKFCGDCGTQLSSLSVTKTLQTPPTSTGKTIAGKYESYPNLVELVWVLSIKLKMQKMSENHLSQYEFLDSHHGFSKYKWAERWIEDFVSIASGINP